MGLDQQLAKMILLLPEFKVEAARRRGTIPGWCWAWDPSHVGVQNRYASWKGFGVHRLSCLAFVAPCTAKKPFVLHSCDRSWCWNPHHLRPGAEWENIADQTRVHEAQWV